MPHALHPDSHPHAHEAAALPPLAQALRRHTRGAVLFGPGDRARYATDASIYQQLPQGAFVPADEDDVATAIALAREHGVPITARGAGSSQCGQTVGSGLVVDCSVALRRVVRIDAQAGTAEVQPGLVLDALNAALRPHGLWFPVDVSTSAQATLGGMAGNNSCGSRSIAYGNMVHHVDAIDAWLADGAQAHFGRFDRAEGRARELGETVRTLAARHAADIDAHWPRVLRRVGGYNLDVFDCKSPRPYQADGGVNLGQLLVGSEGTLAFSRRLHLKLAPLPAARALAVVNFPSFGLAMRMAQPIAALAPSAVELVDRTLIDLARANPSFAPVIDGVLRGAPQALLLVEFEAGHGAAAELPLRLARLAQLLGDHGLPGAQVELTDAAAQRALWEVRKAGLNIMMSVKGDGKPVSFIEDCAVPLEHLEAYTAALTEVFARHGTRGTWYAHASVGTLHVRPIIDLRDRAGGTRQMRAIAEEAAALVRRFRGAYSGEHGDGLCRGEWIAWQFGARLVEAFAAIKHAFDPEGRFAPRRIVEPPPMDEPSLLRYTPAYRVLPLEPVLDWSAWDVTHEVASGAIGAPGSAGDASGGLAKAVEMCNNNGHCRKFDAEAMCPSFRATRAERDSTRGRANTLRLALSGQLPGLEGHGLDDPHVAESVRDALDLCVACKACRRECPTGVDMARIKTEVLAQLRARQGVPLRARLFASLPAQARAAPALRALLAAGVRWRNRSPTLARWAERGLGLAAARSWPTPHAADALALLRRTLSERSRTFDDATDLQALGPWIERARPVFLFADTMNALHRPQLLAAAARVLEAAGQPLLCGPLRRSARLCCGRIALSQGDVAGARRAGARTLALLAPLARAGVRIVALEPACASALREDLPAVRGLDHADADALARAVCSFDGYWAAEPAAGARLAARLEPWPADTALLLHGHCHQKAAGEAALARATLALVPGLVPQSIAGGCCGMAGSFGYEAEHQDASRAIAELDLLPAVRAAPAGVTLVAAGSSCRAQLAELAGVEALHPAELLAARLRPA
jgi:FAD/FMN-containing dehydrogenase